MVKQVINFCRDEEGGTAIEYGLILAIVAVAIFGSIVGMGNSVGQMYDTVAEDFSTAVNQ